MARLSLSFLGPPQVRIDSNPVKLETIRAMALLAYLAVEQKPARRDTLVLLLWPDCEQSQGRTLLRQTLYSLKKGISGDWLNSNRDTIAIHDDDDVWVDVLQFRDLISSCGTHGHSDAEVCRKCQKPLTEAVALYNDDFLSGWSLKDSVNFDDWIGTQAENLRLAYENALHGLIHCLSDQEQYTQAIDYARKWLAQDRLNETSHRWLMQLYTWKGDRSAVLRQYQECRRILKEEIDAEPLEETTKLCEDIKAGNVPVRGPAFDPGSTDEDKNEISSGFGQQSDPTSPYYSQDAIDSAASQRIKGQSATLNNLPAQITAIIGREKELDKVIELLMRPDVRLVTLTGAGGVGKTRLGLQVASELKDEFEAGVLYVPLESIKNADLVAGTIGAELGLQASGDLPMTVLIKNYLKRKHLLLLLDNFEHVIAASSYISDLLAFCANLKILVTSREVMHLQGEHDFPVPPLSLPDQSADMYTLPNRVEDLVKYDAIRLFVDRAAAAQPDFTADSENVASLAEICRRLDGLPLAIELASTWIRLLPLEELLERMDRRLPFLTRGANDRPPRHQTLRGAIEWSYDLLSEEEKTLFRRISVFAGGFTLKAVDEVCDVNPDENYDALVSLASIEEKSLLKRIEPKGEARFTMLETVREYAEERLAESEETETARRRHAEYYFSMAKKAEPETRTVNQAIWLNKLEMDHSNFRAALAWSIENDQEGLGLKLAVSLCDFWLARGYDGEGQNWLEKAIDGVGDALSAELASALCLAGHFACNSGDKSHGLPLFERGLSMSRKIGDVRQLADNLLQVGPWTAVFNYEQGTGYLEESLNLCKEIGDSVGAGAALCWLGKSELDRDDLQKARVLTEESLILLEKSRDYTTFVDARSHLGVIAERLGNYKRAEALFKECLTWARLAGNKRSVALLLVQWGALYLLQKKLPIAKKLLAEAIPLFRESGVTWGVYWSLGLFAGILGVEGQIGRATKLFGAAGIDIEKAEDYIEKSKRNWAQAALELYNPITARKQLGNQKFKALMQEGHSMSEEEAIKCALEDGE